jgi:hypothetical protein
MVMMFRGWVNEANGFRRGRGGRKQILVKLTGGLQIAVGEALHRRTLRLAGVAKQPAFQRIEAVGGGKKPGTRPCPAPRSRPAAN